MGAKNVWQKILKEIEMFFTSLLCVRKAGGL